LRFDQFKGRNSAQGALLNKMRRGRESNPRIAVLQTATLPLGYPAIARRETIECSQALSTERSVGATEQQNWVME
jgi:hypothetical protein